MLIYQGRPCGFNFWNCNVVAWSVEYFGTASVLWLLNIGIFFHLSLIRKVNDPVARFQTELVFNMVGWGLPLILTCVGIVTDVYGPAGDECWIGSDDYLQQFFLDGFWAIGSMLWNFVVIVRAVCVVRRQRAKMTAANGVVMRMM